jgi:hypothetical protein
VLGKQDSVLPRPGPPLEPPASSRRKAWRAFLRRRQHAAEHLVKMMARSSRHQKTGWAELKAAAIAVPNPRLLEGPITPGWIVLSGKALGLDVAAQGSDHQLMCAEITSPRSRSTLHLGEVHS